MNMLRKIEEPELEIEVVVRIRTSIQFSEPTGESVQPVQGQKRKVGRPLGSIKQRAKWEEIEYYYFERKLTHAEVAMICDTSMSAVIYVVDIISRLNGIPKRESGGVGHYGTERHSGTNEISSDGLGL